MPPKDPDIWLKAAVAGGLWASFEIIVGSLLHNLHLPFSGTLLAGFSVMFMIAFLQIWNSRGLIWRAGLICALMKSLSPSAIILGPMTGILMEALLMEAVLYLLGRHLTAYLIAGSVALLSAILHKLANLFILYGSDLLNIYSNLFFFMKKQFPRLEADAGDLILSVALIYSVLGSLAALAGFLLGRNALRKGQQSIELPKEVKAEEASDWQKTAPGQTFHLPLLVLHGLMIPLSLVMIRRYGLALVPLLPLLVYAGFLFIYYPRILRRLAKPFFWMQLLFMTLLAGFFWQASPDDPYQSGFEVGLEMCLRAILIVSAFSAFSVEIRNPRISGALNNAALHKAHEAIGMAFAALPLMLDRSSRLTAFLKKPLSSLSGLLAEAESWLAYHREKKD
ncbi:MAG: hypothetical protein CSA96_02225 [Bacteroidetes bacterium]|nr:MAG: hypothetical protein CSA96_02225 [Bacteroidota bacterium]